MAVHIRSTGRITVTIIICNNCGNETRPENPFSMREENVIYISKCQDCVEFHQNKKDMSDERAKVERPRQKTK